MDHGNGNNGQNGHINDGSNPAKASSPSLKTTSSALTQYKYDRMYLIEAIGMRNANKFNDQYVSNVDDRMTWYRR